MAYLLNCYNSDLLLPVSVFCYFLKGGLWVICHLIWFWCYCKLNAWQPYSRKLWWMLWSWNIVFLRYRYDNMTKFILHLYIKVTDAYWLQLTSWARKIDVTHVKECYHFKFRIVIVVNVLLVSLYKGRHIIVDITNVVYKGFSLY